LTKEQKVKRQGYLGVTAELRTAANHSTINLQAHTR